MSDRIDLKRAGLKVTWPRKRILELFQDAGHRHLTAEDVYRLLQEQSADIGLATVYRVLGQLEQAGLLKQGRFQSDKAVYELDDGRHHDHLVCTKCGHVREFYDERIENLQRRVAQALGFTLEDHTLVLYGNCTRADCEHRTRD